MRSVLFVCSLRFLGSFLRCLLSASSAVILAASSAAFFSSSRSLALSICEDPDRDSAAADPAPVQSAHHNHWKLLFSVPDVHACLLAVLVLLIPLSSSAFSLSNGFQISYLLYRLFEFSGWFVMSYICVHTLPDSAGWYHLLQEPASVPTHRLAISYRYWILLFMDSSCFSLLCLCTYQIAFV